MKTPTNQEIKEVSAITHFRNVWAKTKQNQQEHTAATTDHSTTKTYPAISRRALSNSNTQITEARESKKKLKKGCQRDCEKKKCFF